ncbi:FMN hydrolase / 5-amino-6-(5-phospho-D-ribitylamino)uracil phosphatase [Burkholderiales bacterium]|nr:FMN hydrolase / 5-amino-6-(5-phospho-D-ribitylamino)uracil phosphatase [Burkholderiales bacterium]
MSPRDHDVGAILFDLGGVLIELAGVERMLAWSPSLGTADELWRRWLASPAVRSYETGRTTREAFGEAIVAEFGLPVDAGAFLEEFAWWPRALHPGAAGLLAALAPRYTLASLSNTNELHWERFGREWGLPGMFHHNFPSYAVGKLKPDGEYFEHVLGALGVPAGRALFVDDNRINVEAACAVGLHARHVPHFDALAPALAELGIRTT